MGQDIDSMLQRVSKPARYAGGEWNQVVKDHRDVDVTFAFAFPDVYEVGMSHLGLKIVYHLLNRRQDAACERVFAPWTDMEDLMRERGVSLFSLETRTPVREFDIVGFTLQYEMTYTNVLNMIDLAGIPLASADRGAGDPLVIGGGPCALNPEPLAEVFDCVLIGDAEGAIDEIIDAYRDWKSGAGGREDARAGMRAGRRELLIRLARIEGCYVPSFYRPEYYPDGVVRGIEPLDASVPERVTRRVARNLDLADFPLQPIVPFIDVVHDRAVVELFRGCTRGCRFCQAGMIYRPVRERPMADVENAAREILRNTGHDELSLMSLSSTDYGGIQDVIMDLTREIGPKYVNISLPSLRADAFSVGIAGRLRAVRKSGLTFAPEAGTQRLRDVINKQLTEKDLFDATTAAFEAGWDSLKLYFMIGLPTETDEDIEGITSLARQVMHIYREVKGGRGSRASSGGESRGASSRGASRGCSSRGGPRLTVSASSFVPKAHTPFQWEAQDSIAEIERKQALLRDNLRMAGIRFDWHDPGTSLIEAVLARGDRRLGAALVDAWKMGARFDSWSDKFKVDLWHSALRSRGLDPAFYANRVRPDGEIFPWEHIDSRLTREFLLRERDRAFKGVITPDCRSGQCEACGVCD